jgi:hypothetical protein
MSYTLIERKELTAAASSIEFTAIPQFYTDLVLNVSSRTDGAGPDCLIRPNGSTSNMSGRRLRGNGSNVLSSIEGGYLENSVSTDTASTFSNGTAYFSNYSGSTFKSFSTDAVRENNATDSRQAIMANLWSDTAPITSITIVPSAAVNFVAGSTFSLYGINRQQAIGKPKAIGGAITFANGYWAHTFNASGTFYALENLSISGIVVGGGGGGGAYDGGGGGAGGFLQFSNSVFANSSSSVTIGSGGPGGVYYIRGNGEGSSFLNTSTSGGGGGGVADAARGGQENGANGGSGGGARGGRLSGNSGGLPVSGQGFAGGSSAGSSGYGAGGGGGASAAGANGTTSSNGAGGSGILWNGSYYAGGGGGASLGYGISSGGAGGIGGGGAGGTNGTPGTANTGGGGGADWDSQPGANGGSGVVIILYPAN